MPLDWHPEEFKRKLVAELLGNADLVGKFVSDDAKRRLLSFPELDTTRDGRPYKGGGGYRAYVAGLMTWDVSQDRGGITIKVGVGTGRSGSHHGLYIELGSRTAPARPFLRPAVTENAAKIVAILAGR